MIKAVVFDFFGVLYPDTFWGLADLYLPTRTEEKQRDLHDLLKRLDVGMITEQDMWAEAAEEFTVSLSQLEEDKVRMGGVNGRMIELARRIKAAGLLVGILSNSGVGTVDGIVAADQLAIFDSVTVSGKVGYLKPNPEIYTAAVESFGLAAEECLFFDDIDRYIEGAEGIGMKAVQFTGFTECVRVVKSLVPDLDDQGLI